MQDKGSGVAISWSTFIWPIISYLKHIGPAIIDRY